MSWRSSHFARSSEIYEEPLSDSSLGRWRTLALSSPAASSAISSVLGLHRGAQLPGDDVAGKVVEDRREVEPSPANDLEISEVRLPELVWCRRLILELVRGFHHDEGWAGDQIAGLEEPIDRRLRDKIAFGIGKAHGQFPRGQRGLIQRQPDDALANIVGNAVPDAIRLG